MGLSPLPQLHTDLFTKHCHGFFLVHQQHKKVCKDQAISFFFNFFFNMWQNLIILLSLHQDQKKSGKQNQKIFFIHTYRHTYQEILLPQPEKSHNHCHHQRLELETANLNLGSKNADEQQSINWVPS
jgi:hypothetical protein